METSWARRLAVVAICGATLGVGGCGPTPVPVTPAPLEGAKQQELRDALVGKWEWVGNVKPNGEEESQPVKTYLTFGADGSFRHEVYSIVIADRTDKWTLDGRNIVTTSPAFQTMRAEAWEKGKLRILWYGYGTTMVLARK